MYVYIYIYIYIGIVYRNRIVQKSIHDCCESPSKSRSGARRTGPAFAKKRSGKSNRHTVQCISIFDFGNHF